MSKIQWRRSNDGFVDSKCGKWRISPLYCGSVRPQFFELKYGDKTITRMASSQREAKEDAERWREDRARERREPLLLREGVEAKALMETVRTWAAMAETKAPGPRAEGAVLEAALQYGARVILESELSPALWSMRPALRYVAEHGLAALTPRAAAAATPEAAAGSRRARAGSTRRSAASGRTRRPTSRT